MVEDTRPVMANDLAISVEKPYHQHARDECDEHEIQVCVEGANPRAKGVVVEPGRRLVERFEEIAQDLRRLAQNLLLLFYAGPDEAVQVGGRHRGKLFHDRIEHGIAHSGVPDVVVGSFPVDRARLGVTGDIG